MSQEKEKQTNRDAIKMLLALAFAFNDPLRPQIRIEGHEERDIAYEAGFLSPKDVEMSVYSTQKRGRILSLLRIMKENQWVDFVPKPPIGAYYVSLTPVGYRKAVQYSTPWWKTIAKRILGVLRYGQG